MYAYACKLMGTHASVPIPFAGSINALNHRGYTALLQNCGIIKHTAKNDHSIGNFELKVSQSCTHLRDGEGMCVK